MFYKLFVLFILTFNVPSARKLINPAHINVLLLLSVTSKIIGAATPSGTFTMNEPPLSLPILNQVLNFLTLFKVTKGASKKLIKANNLFI